MLKIVSLALMEIIGKGKKSLKVFRLKAAILGL